MTVILIIFLYIFFSIITCRWKLMKEDKMGNMNILLKIIRFLKGQLVNLSYSEIIRTKISYIPNQFPV